MVAPLVSLVGGDGFPPYLFLMLWPIMLGGVMHRIFGEREHLALETQGAHALVAERERVARDVHDVLGHSLTALSVKAELAARLIDIDPARAKEELESIQTTARQALAEVRATVGGLPGRQPRGRAGRGAPGAGRRRDRRERRRHGGRHRPATPGAHGVGAARVGHQRRTPCARADAVVIELGTDGITVTDDGRGCSGTEGNGLRGMRERVISAGGTLEVTPAAPGTRIRVALP